MTNGLWVTQFRIAGSEARERDPSLLVVEEGGTRSRPNIYVLVESFPRGDAEACRLVIGTIQERLKGRRRSLSGTLRDALRAAHGRLLAQDRREPARVGVSCAVLRGDEVYLAQAGPSLAFVFTEHSYRCLAPSDDPLRAPPLGGEETPSVVFHRQRLAKGDFILLCSPQLPGALQEKDIHLLSGLSPEEAVRGLYLAARQERYFSAILFGVSRPVPTLPAPAEAMTPATPASPPLRTRLMPYMPRLLQLFLLLVAIVLAMAVVTRTLNYVSAAGQRQSEEQFAALLRQSETKRNLALATADATQRRSQLREALKLVNEALVIRSDDRRAQGLKAEISSALAKLSNAFELSDIKLLLDLRRLGRGGARLERIWVSEGYAYLLDGTTSTVFRFPVEPLPPVGKEGDSLETILGRGAPPGAPALSRRVVSLVFMPPGGVRTAAGIIALDEERQAVEYIPGQGARKLVIRGSGEWDSFQDAAGYGGNLYILDAKAGQVWRYDPTESGYDNERKGKLAASRGYIEDARHLVIDGDLYVLCASGAVRKFVDGVPRPFGQTGIDEPLQGPSAIFTSPKTKFVYVADGGGRRIVAFDKDGTFHHQLMVPEISTPYAIFVDEAGGRIYIAAEGSLYSASLPPQAR